MEWSFISVYIVLTLTLLLSDTKSNDDHHSCQLLRSASSIGNVNFGLRPTLLIKIHPQISIFCATPCGLDMHLRYTHLTKTGLWTHFELWQNVHVHDVCSVVHGSNAQNSYLLSWIPFPSTLHKNNHSRSVACWSWVLHFIIFNQKSISDHPANI